MAGRRVARTRGPSRRVQRAVWWRDQIETAETAEEQFAVAVRWFRAVASRADHLHPRVHDHLYTEAAQALCDVTTRLERLVSQ
jgi:hypothetical protein